MECQGVLVFLFAYAGRGFTDNFQSLEDRILVQIALREPREVEILREMDCLARRDEHVEQVRVVMRIDDLGRL